MTNKFGPLKVGIGGPVGSGKTSLTEALCKKLSKTISMAVISNDIYTIDGYHNLYPLSYKKKFYNIIEDELNADLKTKNYFNNWGSRVYAFVGDPQKIQINFKQAKKIGASYVISKYDLNSDQLTLICGDCSKYFKLYLIN